MAAFPSKAEGFLIQLTIGPLTSCGMGGPAYLCWFATQKPNLSPLWLPYENQIAGLEIIVLESFNT